MLKKIFVLVFLFLIPLRSFAMESVISSLIIDDDEEREIEIVMDKDKMYLPCKYILSFFQIPYKENHVDKSLSFNNSLVKNNEIFTDGKKQPEKVFFLKSGITGIKNEFFVPAEVLSKITDKNITSDSSQILAYIRTKDLSEKIDKPYESPFLVKNGVEKIKAYDEITLPIKKGWISLDNVGVNNNMMSDAYSQVYRDAQSKTCSMNSNMQTTLTGRLNSGKYRVELGTNSYTGNMFSFSGLGVQYKNQYKNFDYLIGKPEPWDFGDNNVSTDIMGLQLKDHVDNDDNYRHIDGQVSLTSTVKVSINNDFEKELNTYGGYYSLKDVSYGKDIQTLKVEELLADGSKREILTRKFNKNSKKKIPKRDFIFGINGLQNRLWANNGYIYQSTTKKAVIGFKHHKDVTNKLTFDNFLIADKILSGSASSNWSQSILGNQKYLNYTTMKNPNVLEGETYMGSLTYQNNEKMNSNLYFGASHSVSTDGITEAGLGYFLKCDNNYQLNKDTSLKGSVFAGSPNFYMAGSASGGSGFMADKVGASLGGETHFKNISFSGSYSKYKSNFGNYYQGGLIDFDEYNLLARARFKKFPSISLKINNRKGKNEIGEISSSSCELSMEKRLKCFSFNGGIRTNNYSNQYSAEGYSGYSSDYSDIFTEVNFPLGKRFGFATLGHDIVETKSDTLVNNYNSIKLGYSSPSWHGVNLNLSTGIHYTGTNKGNDFGLGVTKRLKSGSAISLNYRYSQVPCYIVDNMYLPSTMRHSITVDFSELYGIGGKRLEAIGAGNENKGLLQVSAFLDVNQNGVKDKGEPTIENIPIKVENDSEVLLTSKTGDTKLKPEDAGVHNVQIFEDELPTLLSCTNKTKPSRYIKIERNSKTKVDFGLISTVGNINGSVTIKDEFNNLLKVEDLVVSVLDTTGKEVNYSNLNEDGTFSFSGLSPGKYWVGIDKELQNLYKITPETNSENLIIEIPAVYKDYVNIDNVNLNYKYQI